MASDDLRRLWNLAQIDNALNEIRKKAANLDVGQRIQKELDLLNTDFSEKNKVSTALSSELKDLELKQKTFEDKISKSDKTLYGGQVVNPREVEALKAEIESLKKQRDASDERILELYELVPPAKKLADAAEAKVAVKKKELSERRQVAIKEKEQLEKSYKEYATARPEKAKIVSPTLLARYEAIAKGHGGIGMVQALKTGHCGGCGMHLAERTMQMLKDEKTITCEACHRILYWTEGLV